MFLPLKDNLKSINAPVLTILLIIVNCLVFVMFEGNEQDAMKTVVLHGAVPYELTHSGMQCAPTSNEDFQCAPTKEVEEAFSTKFPGAWESVGSSMFLHIGWFHLLGNMLFLFVFGRAVEDTLGRFSFLLFYLVGGIGAVLGHTLYDPNSMVPCVGASGAIAAVMGAYFVMYPRAKVFSLFIVFPCRPQAFWVIGFWLAEQALLAWNMAGAGAQGGTAVFAHFGGFAVGCALTYAVVGIDEIRNQRLRASVTSSKEAIAKAMPPPYDPDNPVPQFVTHTPPRQAPQPGFVAQQGAPPGMAPPQAMPPQVAPPAHYRPDPFAPKPPPPAQPPPQFQ